MNNFAALDAVQDFGLEELQELLTSWPHENWPPGPIRDGLYERIRQVLGELVDGGDLAKPDFLVLVRQALLTSTAKTGGTRRLKVSAGADWPTELEWQSVGVEVFTQEDTFLLDAGPWFPDWLRTGEQGVFSKSFSSEIVRTDAQCAADPFFKDVTGYPHYASAGQREAVRGALLLPPGETLMVNLPTGTGKSLVGQVPALLDAKDGSITIFIVPTVSLAIDQERQIQKYLELRSDVDDCWPLAYHNGTSKEERAGIHRRLLAGTQKILFTSPEALISTLLKTVKLINEKGYLRYLVIDEAHLITHWGDEFRPAFQMLAGLRNSLLEEAVQTKFCTLLLSATFTLDTMNTLASLFGPKEKVQMVSAVHLRPEPQYWNYKARSKSEKESCILEALRHAPRPFILYVTTREEARCWFQILREEGYQRLKKFDGETPAKDRKETIQAWVDEELDGIVATSAFGVGMDKGDVRTIIHAAIPESLDRFYQEVGRGGRDGKPCNSLVVYTSNDWGLAENMAAPSIIGSELGFERWKAIYETRSDEWPDGSFLVDLKAVRSGLRTSNDANEKWNMRTLQLMARTGLLELNVDLGSEVDQDDFNPGGLWFDMRVRLLRHDHRMKETWGGIVEECRAATLSAGNKNLLLVKRMLDKKDEMSAILSELYSSKESDWPVTVSSVCGGCSDDLFGCSETVIYTPPYAVPVNRVFENTLDNWEQVFPNLDPVGLLVFYDKNVQFQKDILRVTRWLVSEVGVQELFLSNNLLLTEKERLDWHNIYKSSPRKLVVHRGLEEFFNEPYSPLFRLSIFGDNVSQDEIESELLLDRPFQIVLLPEDAMDPSHSGRRLRDVASNTIKISQMLAIIQL